MKIRRGAIVDNVVINVYAKFDEDRLWTEKALADRKSDSNKNPNKNSNVGGHWEPAFGSKTSMDKGAITSKIKHAIKLKTSPARLDWAGFNVSTNTV